MNHLRMNQDDVESALIGRRAINLDADYGLAPPLLYAKGGLYAAIVDKPSDKAVSRGVIIEGDTNGVMSDEFDRLDVLGVIADALRWAKLSGGAGIVMLADDGLINEPFDPNRLGQVEELRAFPLEQFSPTDRKYADPTKKNYNQPTHYRVNTGSASFFVHESRIIEITGAPLPPGQNATGIPWAGRSGVKLAYAAVSRYLRIIDLIEKILQRKQQGVYQMVGLADAVEAKLETNIQKRINLVDRVRGVLNTVAVDAEDTYTLNDMALTGLDVVAAEAQIEVSTHARIPVTILFGRSPGGMNATGDSDFQGYGDHIEDERKKAKKALERIVSILWAQSSLPNPEDDWNITWPALKEPTSAEAAEIRAKNATSEKAEMEAVSLALADGILSQEQAIDHLQEQRRFGLEPAAETGSSRKIKSYAERS